MVDNMLQSCPTSFLLPDNDDNIDYDYASEGRQDYMAKDLIKENPMDVIDLTKDDEDLSYYYAGLSSNMPMFSSKKPSWNDNSDCNKYNGHCIFQKKDYVRGTNVALVNHLTNQVDAVDNDEVTDDVSDIDSAFVWRRKRRAHYSEADSTTRLHKSQHQGIGMTSISLAQQVESICSNIHTTEFPRWRTPYEVSLSTKCSDQNEIIILDSSDSENDEESVDDSESNAFVHNAQASTIQYSTKPSLTKKQVPRLHRSNFNDRASLSRHRNNGKVDRFEGFKRRHIAEAHFLGDKNRGLDNKNKHNEENKDFGEVENDIQNLEFGRIAMQLLDLRRNLESFCRKLLVNCDISSSKRKNRKSSSRPVTSLFHMIETLQQSGIIGAQFTSCMHTIRQLGNMAAHSDKLPDKLVIQRAMTKYKIAMNSFWNIQNQK